MNGVTKSLGKKDTLDKFYTKPEIVELCLQQLDLSLYDCIIEPSAGNGAFLCNCHCPIYAYDIVPHHKDIIAQDWFSVDLEFFKQHFSSLLVLGNPPFGQQNALAIKFFNQAALCASTIAFILPKSFKKDSIKNKLDLRFHLTKEFELPNPAFTLNGENYTVPSVFQIWEKKDVLRQQIKLPTTTSIFSFTTKDKADFRIQRVGGNAGKASLNLNVATTSNYFIKNTSNYQTDNLIAIINGLNYPSINDTVGPRSLSKGELIATLEEALQ